MLPYAISSHQCDRHRSALHHLPTVSDEKEQASPGTFRQVTLGFEAAVVDSKADPEI